MVGRVATAPIVAASRSSHSRIRFQRYRSGSAFEIFPWLDRGYRRVRICRRLVLRCRCRQSISVVATIPRLLFFDESGVSITRYWLTACQWHAPTDCGGSVALPLRPTLGLLDLRPSAGAVGSTGSALGRCVAQADLDPSSFADLTCVHVAFGSGP